MPLFHWSLQPGQESSALHAAIPRVCILRSASAVHVFMFICILLMIKSSKWHNSYLDRKICGGVPRKFELSRDGTRNHAQIRSFSTQTQAVSTLPRATCCCAVLCFCVGPPVELPWGTAVTCCLELDVTEKHPEQMTVRCRLSINADHGLINKLLWQTKRAPSLEKCHFLDECAYGLYRGQAILTASCVSLCTVEQM